MDTNANDTIDNVKGILELSKTLLGKSVYVRYLHVTDLGNLTSGKSNTSNSRSHTHLNLLNIDCLVQASGTEINNATSKVEGLSTKSAFFVISETKLVEDMITYVRYNYLKYYIFMMLIIYYAR